MAGDIENKVSELDQITNDVRDAFGRLSPDQINWKPAADSWSVAQCLEHLILANAESMPGLDAALAGKKHSFWESYSPFTSLIGGFMIRSLKSDKRKFKAPSQAIVPPSEIDADIVETFAESQAAVIERVKAMGNVDAEKMVLTSPFMRIMTYKLSDGYQIMVEHERRHIRQAKRVLENEGFPQKTGDV